MTDGRLRVLILGGYGTFGGRLARLLAPEPGLTLLIAGRSQAKAEAFCRALDGAAEAVPLAFDRDAADAARIAAVGAAIVVDATGPFQAYGDAPYRVVEACIAAGADYLDLADGADFVEGIGRFDEAARRRGVAVLSGVSSFPVLTAAVVRHLARGLDRVDSIEGGIAPSPYAGVGLNVIRAIASYAGQEVRLTRGGAPATGRALVETRYWTVAPPGRLPLRRTRFSLVDVPDLRLLPALWPGLREIWIGAGPVPAVLHRGLNALARLVRIGLISTLRPLAPLFHTAINRLRRGEHRGGMIVIVHGRDADGQPVERSWHMLAEGDDGPLIPSMAAAAVILLRLRDLRPAPGARAATEALELADYQPLFAGRAIVHGRREVTAETARQPLYHRMLGTAWAGLPEPVRAMHDLSGDKRVAGRAEVERGTGLTARLVAALIGFPSAGHDVPVAVTFRVRDGVETWQRRFSGRSFSSTQQAGRGRSEGLLEERFGPVRVGLALVLDGDRLRLVVRCWSLLGLPMPLALAPGGEAWETAAEGRFRFHVEIRHPWAGLIVRYRGWLEPEG
ncbi:SDR family oxidoreductase [Inquilinus limosus]|uniref:Saccharopine dehydrogenase n=1 Tax=Inquilinus limosus MP06 TaxID=1398085 RepID=A0A0A0D529_9PROT|nr:SDR family oxidoreductase [Inquilinus limosus]KGM32893.1 saccharopine dehydrogenase [Inquilinus limosus MP06]